MSDKSLQYDEARVNLDITMYNFGSPRVGNRCFSQFYNSMIPDAFRVVVDGDIVAGIPSSGYKHIGTQIQIDGVGSGSIIIDPSFVERRLGRSAKAKISVHSLLVYRRGLVGIKKAIETLNADAHEADEVCAALVRSQSMTKGQLQLQADGFDVEGTSGAPSSSPASSPSATGAGAGITTSTLTSSSMATTNPLMTSSAQEAVVPRRRSVIKPVSVAGMEMVDGGVDDGGDDRDRVRSVAAVETAVANGNTSAGDVPFEGNEEEMDYMDRERDANDRLAAALASSSIASDTLGLRALGHRIGDMAKFRPQLFGGDRSDLQSSSPRSTSNVELQSLA